MSTKYNINKKMMNFFGITEKLSKGIIRPPRSIYQLFDLGPTIFQSQELSYERNDFQVYNNHGYKLQCSIYRSKNSQKQKPVVIYLHANSSSRVSVRLYLKQLLNQFDVVSFDFAGSGLSEGNYTTLGYYQKEDLRAVINYLESQFSVKRIVLWGRSMGAVTAILYTSKYSSEKTVEALVLDSPFANLVEIIHQLALSYISFLPDIIFQSILEGMQQKIDEILTPFYRKHNCRQKFNLFLLCPNKCISNIKIPTFFISGKQDKLVNFKHTVELHQKIGGNKELQLVKGGHNDIRPEHLQISIINYLKSRLNLVSSIGTTTKPIKISDLMRTQNILQKQIKNIPQELFQQKTKKNQILQQKKQPKLVSPIGTTTIKPIKLSDLMKTQKILQNQIKNIPQELFQQKTKKNQILQQNKEQTPRRKIFKNRSSRQIKNYQLSPQIATIEFKFNKSIKSPFELENKKKKRKSIFKDKIIQPHYQQWQI